MRSFLKEIPLELIHKYVEDIYNIEIKYNTKKEYYVEARALFAFLSWNNSFESKSSIGRQINRDHATVIHYINNLHYVFYIRSKKYKESIIQFENLKNQYIKINEEKEIEEYDFVKFSNKIEQLENDSEILNKKIKDLEKKVIITSVFHDIICKIPIDKTEIVKERLEAMIKMF